MLPVPVNERSSSYTDFLSGGERPLKILKRSQTQFKIESLSSELFAEICSFLDIKEAFLMNRLSKRIYRLTSNSFFQQKIGKILRILDKKDFFLLNYPYPQVTHTIEAFFDFDIFCDPCFCADCSRPIEELDDTIQLPNPKLPVSSCIELKYYKFFVTKIIRKFLHVKKLHLLRATSTNWIANVKSPVLKYFSSFDHLEEISIFSMPRGDMRFIPSSGSLKKFNWIYNNWDFENDEDFEEDPYFLTIRQIRHATLSIMNRCPSVEDITFKSFFLIECDSFKYLTNILHDEPNKWEFPDSRIEVQSIENLSNPMLFSVKISLNVKLNSNENRSVNVFLYTDFSKEDINKWENTANADHYFRSSFVTIHSKIDVTSKIQAVMADPNFFSNRKNFNKDKT